MRLRTVGLTADPVRTVGGLTIVPDATIDELRIDDSAMLVLPGADTWTEPEQQRWLEQAQRSLDFGLPVAAICGATYALAAGGFLDHRPHTGPDRGFLASSGYAGTDHFVDELVVTDGDLITASPWRRSTSPVPSSSASTCMSPGRCRPGTSCTATRMPRAFTS